MNKVLAIALVAGAVTAANAQSFSESFDTGPTGFVNGATVTFGNGGAATMAFGSGNWVALNASTSVGTTGWFCNATGVFPTHSGAGHLNANFNGTTGTNTINEFMMSPLRTFNNGDKISFWTRTTDGTFPDRLSLVLSKNGASTAAGDFTTNLLTINPTLLGGTNYPNVYTQFNVTVSGLAGATSGRFAFNYNVTGGGPSGSNSDFIGIDDVQYTAAAVPEPASMAVLGLGLAAIARKRRKNSK